jgi:hypothetical protein
MNNSVILFSYIYLYRIRGVNFVSPFIKEGFLTIFVFKLT